MRGLGALQAILLLASCDQVMSEEGRLKPFEVNSFFPDGQSARPRVAGAVARGERWPGDSRMTGLSEGKPVVRMPMALTRELLHRGRERFEIYCAPCHGAAGYGDGMIARRGFAPPASFHEERLRGAPAGHFVDVITRGFGAMPSYDYLVAPDDRWAIAAYVRALQLSQHAPADAVPPEVRTALETRSP